MKRKINILVLIITVLLFSSCNQTISINQGSLTGIVTLEGLIDFSNAEIAVANSEYTTLTNSQGEFTLNLPEGTYAPGTIRFSKHGFFTTSNTEIITIQNGHNTGINSVNLIASHITIEGIVNVLGIEDKTGIEISIDHSDFSTQTDANGFFKLTNVPLNKPYILRIKVDKAPDTLINLNELSGGYLHLGEITVIPNSASIAGTASIKGLEDRSNIVIKAIPNNSALQTLTCTTDSSGYFRFSNISPKTEYTILITKPGCNELIKTIDNLNILEDYLFKDNLMLEDTELPKINQFTINNGLNSTPTPTIEITLIASDSGSNISSMQYSFTDKFNNEWIPYNNSFKITLPGNNGIKTLHVRVKDGVGNISEIKSASIKLTDQPTKVKGYVEGVWSKNNSPYMLIGDIKINEGKELIIEPGIDVLLNDNYHIISEGSLVATGTEEEQINFVSTAEYTSKYQDKCATLRTGYPNEYKGTIDLSYVNIVNFGQVYGQIDFNHCNVEAHDASGDFNIDYSNFSGDFSAYGRKGNVISNSTFKGGHAFLANEVFNSSFEGSKTTDCNKFIAPARMEYCTISNFDIADLYSLNGYACTFKNISKEFETAGSYITFTNFIDCIPLTIEIRNPDVAYLESVLTNNYWGEQNRKEIEGITDIKNGVSFILDSCHGFNYGFADFGGYVLNPIENANYNSNGIIPLPHKEGYQVGDKGPAGGIIFFIDESDLYDWNYLEAYPASEGFPYLQYGYYRIDDNTDNLLVGATNNGIGCGASNTQLLTKTMGELSYNYPTGNSKITYAAKEIDRLELNGYSDWYIPSFWELMRLQNVLQYSHPEYWTNTVFLSSTELSAETVKGSNYGSPKKISKQYSYYVIPIRAF